MVEFVHLRLHSEYSLEDSLIQIEPLMRRALELELPALGITDLNNLSAVIQFYKSARAAGIKPIIGCDLSLENPFGKGALLLSLLARDATGYSKLLRLLSKICCAEDKLARYSWLEELGGAGLIALSGGLEGSIGTALASGREAAAERELEFFMRLYPDAFYLELERVGHAEEGAYISAALMLAQRADCPLVATNAARFLQQEQFDAHEARVCVQQGALLEDSKRESRHTPQQYLRSAAEMAELFADLPAALENSVEIAKRCNVEIDLGNIKLPIIDNLGADALDERMCELAKRGLEKRFAENAIPSEKHKEYRQRLDQELSVISKMGYAGYFLIVKDFIAWSKQQGIPVGIARGSAGGSLAAYALEITGLDSLRFSLLFERFLNPDRVSLPDIDVDFCSDGRDRVFDYIVKRYGKASVGHIVTFGRIKARAAIRDATRVLGKPYMLGDKLARIIPDEPLNISLEEAWDKSAELREVISRDADAEDVWSLARQLEGLVRNLSVHAGGVVIAPGELDEFCPLYQDAEGHVMTQFDMHGIEDIGLIKFDLLAVRQLSIIDWTCAMIDALSPDDPKLDIGALPLDDEATYKLLSSGETLGVFQLESEGMRRTLRDIAPDHLEDLALVISLYRPGPMEQIKECIARKHGDKKVEYPHALLEQTLDETYGLPVYQEQVMQMAKLLADYSPGESDDLRRVMGKKKQDSIPLHQKRFCEGAQKKGLSLDQAKKIFDLMAKFGGYGFNKSHAVGYAVLAYQAAWLKAHYPAQFMAASMSGHMSNSRMIDRLWRDAGRLGLELRAPDVNHSQWDFSVDEQGRVVFGLGAVKGLGKIAANTLLELRERGGAFTDLFDFCARAKEDGGCLASVLGKGSVEALIACGACDSLFAASLQPGSWAAGEHGIAKNFDSKSETLRLVAGRHMLARACDDAMGNAVRCQRDRQSGMGDLFAGVAAEEARASDPYASYAQETTTGRRSVVEAAARVKSTLGFFLKPHPTEAYHQELARVCTPITRLNDLENGAQAKILGCVLLAREIRGRATWRGSKQDFVLALVGDHSAEIEVMVSQDLSESIGLKKLPVHEALVFDGTLKRSEKFGVTFYADNARQPVDFRQHSQGLSIQLDAEEIDEHLPAELKGVIGQFIGGQCRLKIEYHDRNRGALTVVLNDEWRVTPADELLDCLCKRYGEQRVSVCYE